MSPKISIVIPALNAEQFISTLLDHIEKQTFLPKEVIIVDSSQTDTTENIIKTYNSSFPIIYKKLAFAYPGYARNIGVDLSKYEWIAFLDIRTLPTPDWLEKNISLAIEKDAEHISGVMVASADTHFKKIIKAATYGNNKINTVPGSLILKKAFEKSYGFASHVRAGEDIDWVSRLKKHNIRTTSHTNPTIVYKGFPETFSKAMYKWFINYLAGAKTNIHKEKKFIYLTLLVIVFLIFFFNWNSFFASWNTNSIYFIPNITKIYITSIFFIYFVARGIIKPLLSREHIYFILPWRWLLIASVGTALDLAKAPGLIYGAYLLIKKFILEKTQKLI